MAGKKVFVSYDHSEDLNYKELLRAWNANTGFDFEFDIRSPNVAIDSVEASTIQAALTRKMKEADYLLVIIGEKSNGSKWMNWEIKRAKEPDVKLKLAGVKIKSSNITPTGLITANAAICNAFTLSGIESILNQATNNY